MEPTTSTGVEKPKSIKYFEYITYTSIGVSICLMIGHYMFIQFGFQGTEKFSWQSFAQSIQPIIEGILGLLFIWWFITKKRANWARWLLLLTFTLSLLDSIGGFFVVASQTGFVHTFSLLSPNFITSLLLPSIMLYFLFSPASNEWFSVNKGTQANVSTKPSENPIETESFWTKSRTINTFDFSTMWQKTIPKTNNIFLIIFIALTLPFLYRARFEVSGLYSGIGIVMVFIFILFLLCYFVENFMMRQRIGNTTSSLDTKLYFLILVRNIIFLLSFMFVIGVEFVPGLGFFIWMVILFFPIFLIYFIGFLVSYIGLLIARSRDVKKSNV